MTNLRTNLMKKGVEVLVPLDLVKASSDAAIWELARASFRDEERIGFPGARIQPLIYRMGALLSLWLLESFINLALRTGRPLSQLD
jgi:hypothetical protein